MSRVRVGIRVIEEPVEGRLRARVHIGQEGELRIAGDLTLRVEEFWWLVDRLPKAVLSGPLPERGGPVSPDARYTFRDRALCKGCSTGIYWWETPTGRLSPHDYDGTSHFATCPVQERFRKQRATPAEEQQ